MRTHNTAQVGECQCDLCKRISVVSYTTWLARNRCHPVDGMHTTIKQISTYLVHLLVFCLFQFYLLMHCFSLIAEPFSGEVLKHPLTIAVHIPKWKEKHWNWSRWNGSRWNRSRQTRMLPRFCEPFHTFILLWVQYQKKKRNVKLIHVQSAYQNWKQSNGCSAS